MLGPGWRFRWRVVLCELREDEMAGRCESVRRAASANRLAADSPLALVLFSGRSTFPQSIGPLDSLVPNRGGGTGWLREDMGRFGPSAFQPETRQNAQRMFWHRECFVDSVIV